MNLENKYICTNCFEELPDKLEVCSSCGYSEGAEERSSVLPVGSMLMGRFVIGKVLGKGGFGITYLAYDLKRDCKIAIKEYMPDSLSYRTPGSTLVSTYQGEKEESFKIGADKFYEEAKTVSKFNGHPNIINVFEFFYENNTAYFVMEYIEGVDLKTYLQQKGGTISAEECLELLNPIMDALIVIHSVGILHRDISPDNIYITRELNVKLLDFGAARQVLGEKSKSLSVVLKPGFAPIEQYQTRGKQGQWTDVYALAATMYFCVTGIIPEAAMDRIEEDGMIPIKTLKTGVSASFEKVLLKALALKASDRFQNVSELKQALNTKSVEKEAETAESQDGSFNTGWKTSYISDDKSIPLNKEVPGFKIKRFIPVITSGVIVLLAVAAFGIWQAGNKPTDKGISGGGSAVQSNTLLVASADNTAKAVSQEGSGTPAKQPQAAATDGATASSTDAAAQTTSAGQSSTAVTAEVTTGSKQAAAEKTVQAASASTVQAASSVTVQPAAASSEQAPSTISKPSEAAGVQSKPSQPSPASESKEEVTKVQDKEFKYVTTKFAVLCNYSGEWKDGKPNGTGELKMVENVDPYWEKGDRLSGNFTDGLLNGKGKYTGAYGGSYSGNFINGLKDGYGVFNYSDGSKYEGNFKSGEFHGEGTYTDSQGNVWKGTWESGDWKG